MRALWVLSIAAFAQDGAALYRQSCAVAYCHGADGTAGRALALAGIALSPLRLAGVIRSGIPDKGMPKFEGTLNEDAIYAITQYIKSLPAVAGPSTAAVARRPLTAPEKEGRAVFFDATRMGSCGACHEADDWGSPVVKIETVPADPAALRAFRSTRIKTYKSGSESFPGLAVSDGVVYDLSSPLPVRRRLKATSTPAEWRHDLSRYSDTELSAALRFLRAVQK